MPYGDDKHKRIYDALVNILGEQYVEDDPAVMQAFSREAQYQGELAKLEFWVLPGSIADVQQLYQLANRYRFPVSVSSTGLLIGTCGAAVGYDYWCYIDPKRMNRFHINVENMYAVLEPYVTVAQVQAEAMKLGLFMGSTGAGAQGSALATHLISNSHWVGWRTGKGRNLLGVEGVLPNGDIFRTGTLSINRDDFSWGEGPGISATGVLRGLLGPMSTLGMVTRAAIKLYPWPGPTVYPTQGIGCNKKSVLPPEQFRGFVFHHPTVESCIDAVREIGEAEIGAVAYQPMAHTMVRLTSRSKDEFWARAKSDFWQNIIQNRHVTLIVLWAFTSPQQLDYEEGVLREIIRDTGGEFLAGDEAELVKDDITADAVRANRRLRYTSMTGGSGVGGSCDSLQDALRSVRTGLELKAKLAPLTGDGGVYDMGHGGHSFWLVDFGRIATTGVGGSFLNRTEECKQELMAKLMPELVKAYIGNKVFTITMAFDASQVGPYFANVHLLLARLKQALDPNNIANPTRLVDMKKLEQAAEAAPPSPPPSDTATLG